MPMLGTMVMKTFTLNITWHKLKARLPISSKRYFVIGKLLSYLLCNRRGCEEEGNDEEEGRREKGLERERKTS